MENTEHGDFSPSSNKPVKDLLSLAIAQEKNIEEEDEKVQPPINIEEESDHVQPPINFEEEGRVRQRGVNSVVASGLHFQAAFGVICSG